MLAAKNTASHATFLFMSSLWSAAEKAYSVSNWKGSSFTTQYKNVTATTALLPQAAPWVRVVLLLGKYQMIDKT